MGRSIVYMVKIVYILQLHKKADRKLSLFYFNAICIVQEDSGECILTNSQT